jgi:hypothetical protein
MNLRIAVVMTAFLLVLNGRVVANDGSPESTFATLKKSSLEPNWESILREMTPPAKQMIIESTIFGAAAAIEREFPPGPKGDAHRKRIQQVFADHEVDKIKFPGEPDYSAGQPSEKTMKELRIQRSRFVKNVLDGVKVRDQLLTDISEAMADSPFPAGTTLTFRFGELTEIEMQKKTATAVVVVDPSKLSDDPRVMNIMPPSPIKFRLVDEKWKYDGVDEVKQREITAKQMELYLRDQRPIDDHDTSARPPMKNENTGQILLTATWIPFDDESTYGFAKKWPEINQMQPVAGTRYYNHSFFGAMTPTPQIDVGDTWKIDAKAMLPLLQQFHQGASCELHHGGPTGAYGCLIGRKDHLLNILIRLHGELRHEDGWYYTLSQFEGHLVWDHEAEQVISFRLFVPPVRTNVDVNRSMTVGEVYDPDKIKGLKGVDIGFVPKMELAGGKDVSRIKWDDPFDLKAAKLLLAKKFYRSAFIDWMPWEEAVAESQKTGKPLHVVALFGTLNDESC